ncbi:MAG: hypothetical protein GX868_09060 [Actinobacteria bacterium]|nr:hypothetical protein [Actinomycetota bacterium]
MKHPINFGAFTPTGWGRPPHSDRESTIHAAPEPTNVLVLSGGGIYGAAQAGMLRALIEGSSWRPDVIVGTSAGALNGSWVASEFSSDAAHRLSEIWCRFDSGGVFPQRGFAQLLNVIRRRPSVQDGARLRSLIAELCPAERLEDLGIPLHVSATNIRTGLPHWFSTGVAREVLYASAALPALVPPAIIDGVAFVDGGVVANLPVQRAAELGGQSIVCLDVSACGTDDLPRTALGMLTRSFSIALNAATDAFVEAVSSDRELWRIRPQVDASINTNDWRACRRLVEAGHSSMSAWLAEHGAALEPVVAPEPQVDLRRPGLGSLLRLPNRSVAAPSAI